MIDIADLIDNKAKLVFVDVLINAMMLALYILLPFYLAWKIFEQIVKHYANK